MHFLPQLEHQEVARRTDQRGSKEGEEDLQAYKKKDELNLLDLAKVLRNMHKSTGSSVSSEEPKGHRKEKSEITCLSGRNHLLCHTDSSAPNNCRP